MPHTAKKMMDDLIVTSLEAGAVIMDVYATDFTVMTKDDASPVTEADQRAEAIITKALERLAPTIPMVGEEAVSEGIIPDISGGTFWLVDPLDGTKEFVHRRGAFTVNIGLIEDNRASAGVVYAPDKGQIWWGMVGVGAWTATVINGTLSQKRAIQTRSADPDALTIVASLSHRSPALEAWIANYPKAESISIGSSLKFCLLAEGAADIYPRFGPTCEWDTAAAHAVLKAAGGSVTTIDGKPFRYAKDPKTFLNPHFMARGDVAFQNARAKAD